MRPHGQALHFSQGEVSPGSIRGHQDLRVTRDNRTMKRNGPRDFSPSGRSVIRTVQNPHLRVSQPNPA